MASSSRALWAVGGLVVGGLVVGCESSPAVVAHDAATDRPTADTAPTGCTRDAGTETIPEAPPARTPRWAFEPWISKDISTTDDTYAFVDGFRMRDIPVGAVVLDSPWETSYNTFVPHPVRYHDFARLVTDMHGRGVRVVLWITQFVNRQSFDLEQGGDTYVGPASNFDEGTACGFFVNSGDTYRWWKGAGAAVDFLNPRALAWWHRQQDRVIDLGIDGFKVDFGDSYVPGERVQTAAGMVPHQRYGEEYYHDFYAYGRSRREDFVTMVRGWDASYGLPPRFFARPEHAPVVWAGDNRRDWVGLIDALDTTFRSAAAHYVMVGSDIGGYLDRDDIDLTHTVPFDQDTFARWTALGALMPFMQLHGRANLTPWTVEVRPEETERIYRYWAKLHHELVPFFYSLAEEAYNDGTSLLHPIGTQPQWVGDYRYLLGEALLVAPVLDASGHRDVALPAGARWYDWWSPSSAALEGGRTLMAVDTTDRARIPVYVREGAIVPMSVSDGLTGFGTAMSAGAQTVLVWPAPTRSRFVTHDEDGTATVIQAQRDGATATVTLTRVRVTTLLRVRADDAPTAVSAGAALTRVADRAALDAAPEGYWYDAMTRSVWVKLARAMDTRTVTVTQAM